jgi:hypothetical protein
MFSKFLLLLSSQDLKIMLPNISGSESAKIGGYPLKVSLLNFLNT